MTGQAPFTLTLTFNSLEDVDLFLNRLKGIPAPAAADLTPAPAPAPEKPAKPASGKGKGKAKAKPAAEAAPPQEPAAAAPAPEPAPQVANLFGPPGSAPAPAPTAPAVDVSNAGLQEWLKARQAEGGTPRLIQLMQEFKAANVSELDETGRLSFVAKYLGS